MNTSYSNENSLDKTAESKSVVYKEFPVESIIPAVYGRRRYFDYQGYIEFLCKERDLRKTSPGTRRLNVWEKMESKSWLNNFGDVLVCFMISLLCKELIAVGSINLKQEVIEKRHILPLIE